MNRPDRQMILAVGVPGTGKTVITDRIADAMILHAGYDSIFVLDPLEQRSTALERYIGDLEQQIELLEEDEERVRRAWTSGGRVAGMKARTLDGPLLRTVAEYSEYCELFARERESKLPRLIPPRVIWRCGPSGAAYAPAIAEACDVGNVVLVMSESRLWYPNHRYQWPINDIPGRSDLTMEHLITMGRAHIRNRAGDRCALHMVLDAQDFMMLHNYVRKNCEVVLCGRLEGGESFRIVQAEFGDGSKGLVERVRKLENHEWIAVRGEMPEIGPYRGGGR
jgi:hypothetical protein